MADPDEALIGAIAEAIAGGPAALVDLQLRDPGTASNAYRSARAAFAALVEHLGLVEETTPICKSNDMDHVVCWRGSRRLVSRWVEVDHG